MQNKTLIIILIIVAILISAFWLVKVNAKPGALDEFAQCLKEKEAVFYGAFWCPYCQKQKKMFGKSANLIPYIECSAPDGRSQKIICNEKGVESYPTWDFKDGERTTGLLSLAQLSEKTGCQLP